MKASVRLLTAAFLIATLASCSLGYDRQWRKAASANAAAPSDLTGAWEGTWKSQANGHTGTLKAIVTKAETPASDKAKPGKEQYVFTYKATWKRILTGVIEATHEAQKKGNHYTLSGQKDLGAFGGIFSFTGESTPSEFHADYKAKLDHGVFDLKRPMTKKN